jgi:hypothetical protein
VEIPVLVEPLEGKSKRFRATAGSPWGLTTEGSTGEEAVGVLCAQLQERISSGARIIAVAVPVGEHPLAAFAGGGADDPLFEDWKQAVAEYRRTVEADPSSP